MLSSRLSRVALALLATTLAPAVSAQTERRAASPRGSSATEIGGRYVAYQGYAEGRWIEIDYGRPIKRERALFTPPDFVQNLNGGAPVWRAGANQSTVLRTQLPLLFGDAVVEPGEYTVFIQLAHEEWTFILSRWPAQKRYDQNDRTALFGAYHYRPNKDVVRLPMALETLPHSFDQLSWQFLDMSAAGGRLALLWDDRLASVEFRVANEGGDGTP
ncbi:MAG: DUF2911 domain-containing protein [Acidobacteriota bacterium]